MCSEREGHSLQSHDTAVDQQLVAFKRPRLVVAVDELPKTPTGKIQRFRLRERASGLAAEPEPVV